MLIFDSLRHFMMNACTKSHKTLRFSAGSYHGLKDVELAFRNTLYIESTMSHLNLRIETVEDDTEINYLKGKMLIYAGDPKQDGNALEDKRRRLDRVSKNLGIKFYRLVSMDFSGFICCASIDIFEDGVKLLSTWGGSD